VIVAPSSARKAVSDTKPIISVADPDGAGVGTGAGAGVGTGAGAGLGLRIVAPLRLREVFDAPLQAPVAAAMSSRPITGAVVTAIVRRTDVTATG